MAALKTGTILENTYQIVEEIGSGGGGIVFRARHLRLDTDIVVKKIKDEVFGKIDIEQEAKILKNLKHSYLPKVYDFIVAEDGVYTVMDFIHGENLDEAVQRHGKYPQKQVLRWAEQLGEALQYLHSQKPPIIHSDIKPANIMLTKEGNLCLIDFNIALALGGEMESAVGVSAGFSPPEQYRDPAVYARITGNDTVSGSAIKAIIKNKKTHQESAGVKTELETYQTELEKTGMETELETYGPEAVKTELVQESNADKMEVEILADSTILSQAQNQTLPDFTLLFGRGVDARSDIYSLGVTLYYLLTGIAPAVDFDRRIPVSKTSITISEGFAVILEKMTDLSPDKRYQNGREFLRAVRNCSKLDHRYIVMHRKQTGLQMAALAFLGCGILTISLGFYKMRAEKNSNYYNLIKQAQEVMSLNDYQEAEKLLADAKLLSETRVEAYEEEVYLLFLSGAYEKCISSGITYINTLPFLLESEEDKELFGNIYYIVGNAYFEYEDYSNARVFFEDALEYNQRNGLYYRDYAITLAKLGQVEKAQKQLEKGINLGIAKDSIYMAQGEIAHIKGQGEEAIEYFRQTIAISSDMQMVRRAVLFCAETYKAMGRVDEEIALLEQYLVQFEGNGNIVMLEELADAYVRKARTDETQADTCYQKALNLFQLICDKGHITYQIQENMAVLYEYMDSFDEAEALLQQMAGNYPQRYEIYKRLAYLEADRQQVKENEERDYGQMQRYYEQAKERYPSKEQDLEMDMLDQMMQDLQAGGWF